jgi:hypothetical protein
MIWLILIASHLIMFCLGALFVMLWEHLEWKRVEEYRDRDIQGALRYHQDMEDIARAMWPEWFRERNSQSHDVTIPENSPERFKD